MPFDVPLLAFTLYTFITLNFFGWELLHDKRYIAYVLALVAIYIITASLHVFIRERIGIAIRLALLLLFIVVTVYVITVGVMLVRQKTSVGGFINDSGVQVEVGGRYLLLGKNPYKESYEHSDLALVPFLDDGGGTKNPALFHNAYPPLTIILSAIGFRFASQFIGFFDIRMVFLVFYTALILFGVIKFKVSMQLILYIILVLLNPMFLNSVMQGSNDVIVLAFLLWAIFFLELKHYLWSGILFGLAIATKQTAWLVVPFVFLYIVSSKSKIIRKEFFVPFVVTAVGVYLPFFLWDPKALFESLVLYMSGALPTSYPINNFGFGTALVAMRVIKSIYDYYPFWIWQGSFGLAYICLFWRIYRSRMRIVHLITGYATLLSISFFFNRFMNFSYLAFLMVILALSYLWEEKTLRNS